MYKVKILCPSENYETNKFKTLDLIIAFPSQDFWESLHDEADWDTDVRIQKALHTKFGENWYIDDVCEPYGEVDELFDFQWVEQK